MEYSIGNKNNIEKLKNDFTDEMKRAFDHSVNNLLNEEFKHFKIIHEAIYNLPFVKDLINENNLLKLKINDLENKLSGNVSLQIMELNEFKKKINKIDIENTLDKLEISDLTNSNLLENYDEDESVEESVVENPSTEESVVRGHNPSDKEDSSADDENIFSKPTFTFKSNVDEKLDLCKNTDCVGEENEEYTESCNICDGYFKDDGLNDILFIEEEPNNRKASCDLCKKTKSYK